MILTPTGELVFYVQCIRTGCARPDWPTGENAEQAEASLLAEGWSEGGVCPSCLATDGTPTAVLVSDALHDARQDVMCERMEAAAADPRWGL